MSLSPSFDRLKPVAAIIFFLAFSARAATLVVLPFDNLTGDQLGTATISEAITRQALSKGWQVAKPEDVEATLEENRVRYLDSLDDPVRQAIIEKASAAAIVSGTVYTYSEGRNPIVAISARLVLADGSIEWADVAALSADDTEGVFGFGRAPTIEFLAQDVVEKLLRQFPRAGGDASPVHGKGKPIGHRGPSSFRVADLDPSAPHLVCILPFENISDTPQAPRIVADVLAIRLAEANGFEALEPAKLRAAALKAHIGSFRDISTDDLARLASAVGTSLFLRGTIDRYVDVTSRARQPELQIELSLVDVRAGRLLWTAQHDRKGGDYIGFLMLGAASNAVTLTDRVVTEMIATAARGPTANANGPARAALHNRDQQTQLRDDTKGSKQP
jgi:peptidoglycan-synthase activator LpoB